MLGARLLIYGSLCTPLCGIADLAIAQSANQRGAQQATYTSARHQQPKNVTFGRAAPAVGDSVEQMVRVEMRLSMSLRRGNQIGEKTTTTMRNEQQRTLTTVAVTDGRPTTVDVRYDRATTHVEKLADGGPLPSDAPQAVAPVSQAVEGKSYRCRREGGSAGALVITDAAGHIPPMSEYEIVARHMESVGQPNPFVEFLAGRTMRRGETLAVPKEIARRLFGMGDQFGDVLRFDLTLKSVETESGARLAVFFAEIDAASNDSSQMRLQVEGPLVVEIDSCRAVSAQFNGPIGMSETRGSYSTAHQVIGTGKLAVAIESTYRDAKR